MRLPQPRGTLRGPRLRHEGLPAPPFAAYTMLKACGKISKMETRLNMTHYHKRCGKTGCTDFVSGAQKNEANVVLRDGNTMQYGNLGYSCSSPPGNYQEFNCSPIPQGQKGFLEDGGLLLQAGGANFLAKTSGADLKIHCEDQKQHLYNRDGVIMCTKEREETIPAPQELNLKEWNKHTATLTSSGEWDVIMGNADHIATTQTCTDENGNDFQIGCPARQAEWNLVCRRKPGGGAERSCVAYKNNNNDAELMTHATCQTRGQARFKYDRRMKQNLWTCQSHD